VTIDLTRHWDGQQVRFACCERGKGKDQPWGRMFWCVAIEPTKEGETGEGAADGVETHTKLETAAMPNSGDID
jgi:predicted RecA/RadA family phage recombinase